ncbi:MAG: hypothetical protein WA001_02640 [Patescibacteria group bacterium]
MTDTHAAQRQRQRLKRTLAVFSFVTCLLLPLSALADCCRCTGATPGQNVCLTVASGGCATIKTTANNTNISSLTCDTTSIGSGQGDGQCNTLPQGICTVVSDAATYNPTPTTPTGSQPPPLVPNLNVQIPGLTLATTLTSANGQQATPFLAEYIAGWYRYLLGACVVAAAVMIAYGGFQYILGSSGASISSGKETITNALIGLFLVFAAYTILNTLNPATITPSALSVATVSPDEFYLLTNGTGDPVAAMPTFDDAANAAIPGIPSPAGTFTPVAATQPTPGQPASPPPVTPGAPANQAPVPILDTVDISGIPFDASLGGPANMNNYCTPKGEAAQATTYQQKVNLLVKAVLGWKKVCIDKGLCSYVQAGGTTIPNGAIRSGAAANYIQNLAISQHTSAFSPESGCEDIYNASHYAVNNTQKNPQCPPEATQWYQQNIVNVLQTDKYYGADCGGFVMSLFSCAGATWTRLPTEPTFNSSTGKPLKGGTAYYDSSPTFMSSFVSMPDGILSAHQSDDILGLAAKKGGLQFGDIIYTSGGGATGSYAAHYFLYTGGRPDVPFTFIEMGGANSHSSPPGIPGGLSGVVTKPLINKDNNPYTIVDYLNSKSATTNLSKGVIYVWRPYGDSPGAPTGQ